MQGKTVSNVDYHESEETVMDNVKEYVELVKAPWGKMFYDLLFTQLNIPQTVRSAPR